MLPTKDPLQLRIDRDQQEILREGESPLYTIRRPEPSSETEAIAGRMAVALLWAMQCSVLRPAMPVINVDKSRAESHRHDMSGKAPSPCVASYAIASARRAAQSIGLGLMPRR